MGESGSEYAWGKRFVLCDGDDCGKDPSLNEKKAEVSLLKSPNKRRKGRRGREIMLRGDR